MKTAPSDYGAWAAAHGDGADDGDPFLTKSTGGINADDEPLAGEVHRSASLLEKALYVFLLVIFGSGMTLIVSAQDRYCIENCYGRDETYHYPQAIPLCAAAHEWDIQYVEACSNGEALPPMHPIEDEATEAPTGAPPGTWTAMLRQLNEALPWSAGTSQRAPAAGEPVYFLTTRTPYVYTSMAADTGDGHACTEECFALDPSQLEFNSTVPRFPNSTYEECVQACCTPHAFHQPFIQLFQMGCGQVLTGLTYKLYKHAPAPGQEAMAEPSFKQFAPKAALASLFDALAEVFIILGLGLTAPATAEMMKATLVIFTGLVSSWFFKDFKLTWKQWVATGIMLVGASLVIMQEYIYVNDCALDEGESGPLREVIGALFTVVAQIFYAFQFITEESLIDENKVRNQHVNKALLVFCEGIVSILAAFTLQVPFTYIADPDQWEGFVDDFMIYFHDPILFGTGIGLSACVAGFDIWGLLTAEHMGSDLRAVVCASFQVVLVWTISLVVPHFGEYFNPVALVGFIIILVAGLTYSYTAQGKEDPRSKSKERLLDNAH